MVELLFHWWCWQCSSLSSGFKIVSTFVVIQPWPWHQPQSLPWPHLCERPEWYWLLCPLHIPQIWLHFTADMVVQSPGLQGLSLQGYSYNSHCAMTIPHECNFYELVMSNAPPGGKELEYEVAAFHGTKVVQSISGIISLTSDEVVRQHLLEGCEVEQPSRLALMYAILNSTGFTSTSSQTLAVLLWLALRSIFSYLAIHDQTLHNLFHYHLQQASILWDF